MVDNNTLEWEIDEARKFGCIIRVKRDAGGSVSDVSIGMVPELQPYSRIGTPESEWLTPSEAHSRLQTIFFYITGKDDKCQRSRESGKAKELF